MASVRKTLRHIFVWTYERGTIQYDIICALILAFIFFTPRSCFVPKKMEGANSSIHKAGVAAQPAPVSNDQKQR